MVLLGIAIALIMLSVVGSAYARADLLNIIDNSDTFRMNQIVDSFKSMIVQNGNMSDPCYRFFAAFHQHMTNLFTENKDDIIKILIEP
jgi:hypothetical protein